MTVAEGNDRGTRVSRPSRARIERWLPAGQYGPGQVDEIVRRIQHWQAGHPMADDHEREAVWTAIAEAVGFTLDLEAVGNDYVAAREAAESARVKLRASVIVACTYGAMTAAEAARQTGVNRNTVQLWLSTGGDEDQ